MKTFRNLVEKKAVFKVGDVIKHKTAKPYDKSVKPITVNKIKSQWYKLSNGTSLPFGSESDWEINNENI